MIILVLTVAYGRHRDKSKSLLTFINISDCDGASVVVSDSEDCRMLSIHKLPSAAGYGMCKRKLSSSSVFRLKLDLHNVV